MNTTGFAPEPDGRGTVSLIWQCLLTIFLCTFTVLHFDVPRAPVGRWETTKWSTVWVICGLLAPESVCFKSYRELVTATKFRDSWNKFPGSRSITLKQAFFLIAGGLKVECFQRRPDAKLDNFLDVNVFCYDMINFPEEGHWFKSRIIQSISASNDIPSDDQIDASSKADVMTKLIAIFQAAWTLAQVVTRLASKLEVSLLEVLTTGLIVATVMSYAFWFRKPYNIGEARSHVLPEKFRAIQSGWMFKSEHQVPFTQSQLYDMPWHIFDSAPFTKWTGLKFTLDPQLEYLRGHLGRPGRSPPAAVVHQLPVMVFGLALAATHLAAWSYPFPTSIEAWMWRAASIFLGLGPIFYCALGHVMYSWTEVEPPPDKRQRYFVINTCLAIAILLVIFTYAIARAYMVVEVFLSLRAAPRGIYQTPDWTKYWFHIG